MRLWCLVLLAIAIQTGAEEACIVGKATSCVGRCGQEDGTSGCQCNSVCSNFGDCCSDYEDVCLSCVDRCGDSYVASAPCQCNDDCASHGNCCQDYDAVCGGGSGVVTDAELLKLSEELSALDTNNMAEDVVIAMQGHTTSGASNDEAPQPLFTSVPALSGNTYVLFEAIRNNYVPQVNVAEDNTAEERSEVSAFLDAVMATPLMEHLEQFMTEKQILQGTLRANIEEIWFTLYSRSGSTLGSSGFEHSFIGELDGSKVSGFHNWISFLREEESGNADYMGYIEYSDLLDAGYVLTNRFTWYTAKKSVGDIFISTSPEFELAVYTLCFFTRPNAVCTVQTNGVEYNIQTYELVYNGHTLVGSAYPFVKD